MDETQHDARDRILDGKVSEYSGSGVVRTPNGSRGGAGYTYQVVHTQESVWVQHLRIAADEPFDLRYLPELLRAISASITIDACLDVAAGGGTE